MKKKKTKHHPFLSKKELQELKDVEKKLQKLIVMLKDGKSQYDKIMEEKQEAKNADENNDNTAIINEEKSCIFG